MDTSKHDPRNRGLTVTAADASSPQSVDGALCRAFAVHGPYWLDINRCEPVHTFVVRDKTSRWIAEVNKYLTDREVFAEALPRLLNNATADTTALDAIAARLDGAEWDSDTGSEIAAIVRGTGRVVRDIDDTGPEAPAGEGR